jgi:uncharacterized membrane protein YeaQ/YmgE (transglycosylase-associated protein family)
LICKVGNPEEERKRRLYPWAPGEARGSRTRGSEPFRALKLNPPSADHRRLDGSQDAQGRTFMDSHSLIAWLVIGAIAGWLAGTFVRGGGFGLLGDIVVGIIGAFIGGWLANQFHIHVGTGWISAIITGFVGASLLLIILRAVRRRA